MRRTLFVAAIHGLTGAVAAPAAARDVSQGSQSLVQMQGYRSSDDDTTGFAVTFWRYLRAPLLGFFVLLAEISLLLSEWTTGVSAWLAAPGAVSRSHPGASHG